MKRLLVLLAAIAVATTGMTADNLWTGAVNNDWATAGNWTNGVPGSADTARIYTGTADITANAGSVNNFYVGRTNGASTVNISADLSVINDAYMGYASRATDVATVNQTAGNVVLGNDSTDRVHFGRGNGQSIYNLSGGTLETKGDWTRFGNYDHGTSTFTFNQTGGTFTDSGGTVFSLADYGNAVANINLSGGTFHANNTGESRMADDGTATIAISGTGAMDSSTPIFGLGWYSSAIGTMNLSDNGTFAYTGNDLRIGRSGTGIMNLTNSASVTSSSGTYVAFYTHSHGTVTVDGDSQFHVTGTADTRIGNYGTGTLTVKGSGVMDSTSSSRFAVGAHGRSDASGTLNILENGTVTSSAAEFGVGFWRDTDAGTNAAVGTLNVAGNGTLNHSGAVFSVGRSGDGTLNLSENGTINLSGKNVYIGRYYYSDVGGHGVVNMSGGTLTQSDSTSTFWVGYDGTGDFNQTGGALEVARLRLADDARSTGTYSISGGSLKANAYITGGTAAGSDGTFEVLGSGATSIEAANISFYDDTLRVVLDENGSTLMVADKSINTNYNGQIDIRGTFELDTDGTFDGVVGDVYNIGWASDTILTNGMTTFTVLSGTAEFEYSILDNVDRNGNAGTGQMLQVTVIPEPATLGMIAFVGGAMVWIRRKFMI